MNWNAVQMLSALPAQETLVLFQSFLLVENILLKLVAVDKLCLQKWKKRIKTHRFWQYIHIARDIF